MQTVRQQPSKTATADQASEIKSQIESCKFGLHPNSSLKCRSQSGCGWDRGPYRVWNISYWKFWIPSLKRPRRGHSRLHRPNFSCKSRLQMLWILEISIAQVFALLVWSSRSWWWIASLINCSPSLTVRQIPALNLTFKSCWEPEGTFFTSIRKSDYKNDNERLNIKFDKFAALNCSFLQ